MQLVLPLLLLLKRDCHELQHQQVDAGGHRGQSPQEEAEAGHHISRSQSQTPVLLQRNKVSKPDGGEGDEAIVTRLKIRPTFLSAVQYGPAYNNKM